MSKPAAMIKCIKRNRALIKRCKVEIWRAGLFAASCRNKKSDCAICGREAHAGVLCEAPSCDSIFSQEKEIGPLYE